MYPFWSLNMVAGGGLGTSDLPDSEGVSSTNLRSFRPDLCFHHSFGGFSIVFRPALPAPILFWVKTGSDTVCPHPRQQRLIVHCAGGDSKTDFSITSSLVQSNRIPLTSRKVSITYIPMRLLPSTKAWLEMSA